MADTKVSIFGRNLRAFRESHALKQAQIADAVGVSTTTENKWEKKGVQPRRRIIDELMRTYNLTEDDLLSGTNGYYAKVYNLTDQPSGSIAAPAAREHRVPRTTFVHAGDADEPYSDDGDTAPLPESVWQKHQECYAMTVNGDCMDKVFGHNSTIFIDPAMEPKHESIAVVSIEGEGLLVRKLRMGANTVVLVPMSSNPKYKDKVFEDGDAEIKYVGTVFWYQSVEEME